LPSIELVCVGQVGRFELPDFPFALRAQPQLVSDRFPSPLFQVDFDRLQGWIYHLGNPQCKLPDYNGLFFAYDLLSRKNQDSSEWDCRLEFAPEFMPGIRDLLRILLTVSPEGLVLFTTDWQFGPEQAERFRAVPEEEFWRLHDSGKLRLNSLYPIRCESEPPLHPTAAAHRLLKVHSSLGRRGR